MNDFEVCPKCGSADTSYLHLDGWEREVYWYMRCETCKTEFTQVFTYTRSEITEEATK